MKSCFLPAVIGLGGALLGCTAGFTRYTPAMVARGEIVMRYDRGLELWAGGQTVASGPRYSGLSSFVHCVPAAHRHAEEAEAAGIRATAFSYTAGGLAITGFGGLAGLAFLNKDNTLMAGLLLGGVGFEVLGVVFASLVKPAKLDAIGHAVDAANYYNDAVGSLGGSCADPPAQPAPPAPSEDAGEPSESP